MKTESRQILIECLKRQTAIAASPEPPAWRWWAVQDRDEELEFGPRYASGGWFGGVEEHIRVRLRRAIDSLEKGGLLTTNRKHERRLSHIKLTEAGEELAKSFFQESLEKDPNLDHSQQPDPDC